MPALARCSTVPARAPTWLLLCLTSATTLPSAACTCGPSVSDTDTTDTGSSDAATETSPSTRCGDGTAATGEYCFTRVDLDVAAQHLAIGDFDGDGVPDIATNLFDGRVGHVRLILWRAAQSPTITAPVESRSRSELALHAGDFDGDGDDDLLVSIPGELHLHRNDGTGTLAPATLDDAAVFWPSAPIDLGQDGKPELLTGTGSGSQVQAFELVDDAWTPRGAPVAMSACTAYSLLVTDLDADNTDDVIEVGWPGECPAFPDYDAESIPVAIVRGQGDGSLTVVDELPSGAQPIEAAAGDLDGDGLPELVVVNQGSEDLSLFEGEGPLAFAPQQRIDFSTLDAPLRHAAIADIDGDGRDDLLVNLDDRLYALADPLDPSSAIEVVATAAPVHIADFNGDDVMDIVLLRPESPPMVSVLVSDP